jgi:hypothetical protein
MGGIFLPIVSLFSPLTPWGELEEREVERRVGLHDGPHHCCRRRRARIWRIPDTSSTPRRKPPRNAGTAAWGANAAPAATRSRLAASAGPCCGGPDLAGTRPNPMSARACVRRGKSGVEEERTREHHCVFGVFGGGVVDCTRLTRGCFRAEE